MHVCVTSSKAALCILKFIYFLLVGDQNFTIQEKIFECDLHCAVAIKLYHHKDAMRFSICMVPNNYVFKHLLI